MCMHRNRDISIIDLQALQSLSCALIDLPVRCPGLSGLKGHQWSFSTAGTTPFVLVLNPVHLSIVPGAHPNIPIRTATSVPLRIDPSSASPTTVFDW